MAITEAVYANEGNSAIRAKIDGNSAYITPGGDLWKEAVKIATPYVAPVAPEISLIDRAKTELTRTEHWGSRALEEEKLIGAFTDRGYANLEYRAALREIVAGARTQWPEQPNA